MKKKKLKENPEYKTFMRYFSIYNSRNGEYTDKLVSTDVDEFWNLESVKGYKDYYSLILTEDNYIYLVCNGDNSLAVNTPDDLREDPNRVMPYEFIHEQAFNYLFDNYGDDEFKSFGVPPFIYKLIKQVAKDYKTLNRDRKLSKLLIEK